MPQFIPASASTLRASSSSSHTPPAVRWMIPWQGRRTRDTRMLARWGPYVGGEIRRRATMSGCLVSARDIRSSNGLFHVRP